MADKWGLVRQHCVNDKEFKFWQRFAARIGIRSRRASFYVPVTDKEGLIGGVGVFGKDTSWLPPHDRNMTISVIRSGKRITKLRVKWAGR